MSYLSQLFKLMNASLKNNFSDNWDFERYGEPESRGLIGGLKDRVRTLINRKGFTDLRIVSSEISTIEKFRFLFELLAREDDKRLLLSLVAYRVMGHKKIKLPTNTVAYGETMRMIESHVDKKDFVDTDFRDLKLYHTDLGFLNIPLKIFINPGGVYVDFILKQYEYNHGGVRIGARPGDTVIDAGGCYGDTALYFANEAGQQGKVYVFEFIPDNIKLLKRNVELNPAFHEVITLVDQPLWSVSGKDVYYLSNGPGSFVSLAPFPEANGQTKTVSIDDFTRSGVQKVNLIKMDIEGAELEALKGAVDTIRKFKPKLAIALYHDDLDFDRIPRFLNDLNLGYRFYLLHATIHKEETMLFATTEV